MTQGKSLDELKENLKDIYDDLTSGSIPYVRKVAELEIA
jgi:predicted RNase H-like HicB family nuclease